MIDADQSSIVSEIVNGYSRCKQTKKEKLHASLEVAFLIARMDLLLFEPITNQRSVFLRFVVSSNDPSLGQNVAGQHGRSYEISRR